MDLEDPKTPAELRKRHQCAGDRNLALIFAGQPRNVGFDWMQPRQIPSVFLTAHEDQSADD
jgi:hypothetical protein